MGSISSSSKEEKPGVSATRQPSPMGKSSTWRVVWRPRPSFWETSPVSTCSSGQSRRKMALLPTPELPVKATVFPAMSRRSSSIPSPVSALVQTVGKPAAR